VLERDRSYFVKKTLILPKNLWNWYQHARDFDWQHICKIWWTCFSTEIGISMGTNCAHFADLFLYSNEADFIQGLPKKMMSFH
jgi:hypothetical protein